jgi:hypothetical protein
MLQSPTKGQPPEPEFYVDENLGQIFVSALRVHGNLSVFWARDVFPSPRPEDVVWIPYVAERRWVVIGQDHLDAVEEQAALVAHGASVFVLVGNAKHEALAALFLKKIKWVKKQLALHSEAFLAKIYLQGAATKVIPASDLLARCARRWGC